MSDKRISTTPGYMGGVLSGHITPGKESAAPAEPCFVCNGTGRNLGVDHATPAAPPAVAGQTDERQAFEAWARERYAVTDHSFVRAPDGYAHTIGHRALGMTYASVQMLWEAWRDRAAVASVGTPPAQEQKPLTVEHIERLWDKFMSAAGSGYVPDFVRAIEAAHGIGASLPVGGEGETADEREQFKAWAAREGYDTAHTYDTERSRWVWLSPMTADLRRAWLACLCFAASPAPADRGAEQDAKDGRAA
jgi:hypothetical protein